MRYYRVTSLRGRRLKGKGKGVLGSRETRGAREEGRWEGNACQETIVFAIPPTNYVCKNNATVNQTSCQISFWLRCTYLSRISRTTFLLFPKTRNLN